METRTPQREREDQRHGEDLGDLSDGHPGRQILGGDAHRGTDGLKVGEGEDVVELELGGHDEGNDEKAEVVPVLEQRERLSEGQGVRSLPSGRRVGKRQREKSQDQGKTGRQDEGVDIAGRLGVEQDPHPGQSPVGADPTQCAPDSDGTEVPLSVGQMLKGQCIGQGQGGCEDQTVQEHHDQHGAQGLGVGHPKQKSRAQQMKDGQRHLGRKPAVRHLSSGERSHQVGQGKGGVDQSQTPSREPQLHFQIPGQSRSPGPPDGVLQEHHQAEPGMAEHPSH